MPTDPSINGKIIQWDDLKSNQRKIVSDNIRQTGVDLPKIAQDNVEKFHTSASKTGANAAKARVQETSMRAVQPHLVSKPVTLQTAANARQGAYNRAIDARAAENPDDPNQVIPHGAGWYFDHHKAIADSAESIGFPKRAAIAASGVMSPQNSPDNEVAAVHAIMDTLANHKVHVTQDVHDHLAGKGIDVSQHLGKTVNFDQLPIGSVSHLSTSSIRDKVPTTANLREVARGGTKGNITKAEHVLWGDISPEEAANTHSAPKVASYIHNTLAAEPGSPTHVEYMGRVHQDALVRRGQIDKDQMALDLYGTGEKTGAHLLSPKSHTVEDTWQNSITFDQPKVMAQKKTSVFKAAGSMPNTYPVAGVKTTTDPDTGKRLSAHTDARVGNTALTHAYNNRATQKAAEQQSRGSGVTVPPVAVQEVGWTQVRREAGKDAGFTNQKPEKEDPLQGHVRGQQALWGDHIPGGEHARESVPESSGTKQSDLTLDEQEADLRKWNAIGNNVRKAKRRQERLVTEHLGPQFS